MPNKKPGPNRAVAFHFDVRYGPSSGAKADFDLGPSCAKRRHRPTWSSVNYALRPLASIDSTWAMNLCVGVGTPSFSPMRTRVPEK